MPDAFAMSPASTSRSVAWEMHLIADTAQWWRVRALDLTVTFEAGDGIWTGNSYKFTRDDVDAMLAGADLASSAAHRRCARFRARGGAAALVSDAPTAARVIVHPRCASWLVSDTPTPERLYIHDDVTDAAAATAAPTSSVPPPRCSPPSSGAAVTVITLAHQIDGLLAQWRARAFATTIGIGAARARRAAVHARTGWFPVIARVEVDARR